VEKEFSSALNPKFGYKFPYPEIYSRSAADNDGVELVSPDGCINIEFYGQNNINHKTVQGEYNRIANQSDIRIAYKDRGDTWFVISWSDGNIITYQKTFLGPGCENTFKLTYPEEIEHRGGYVAAEIEKKFTPGNLAIQH